MTKLYNTVSYSLHYIREERLTLHGNVIQTGDGDGWWWWWWPRDNVVVLSVSRGWVEVQGRASTAWLHLPPLLLQIFRNLKNQWNHENKGHFREFVVNVRVWFEVMFANSSLALLFIQPHVRSWGRNVRRIFKAEFIIPTSTADKESSPLAFLTTRISSKAKI